MSKMRRKTIRQCVQGCSPPKPFYYKEHIAVVLNKFVHVRFYVLQTYLSKVVNIFCALPEWIKNIQMVQCFST